MWQNDQRKAFQDNQIPFQVVPATNSQNKTIQIKTTPQKQQLNKIKPSSQAQTPTRRQSSWVPLGGSYPSAEQTVGIFSTPTDRAERPGTTHAC